MAFYEIVQCKHCGRYLGHDDRSASVDIGLDSDECPNNVRCMADAHGIDSPIAKAYGALSVLRDKWALREANELIAAQAS